MQNTLPRENAHRNEVPATMDLDAVNSVGAIKETSIFGPLTPGGIVSERRNRLDFLALALQEFAEGDVVRRDPGYFRRIIDAPND